MHPLTSGPRTARIMVVGEAPGAEEEALHQPFVGQSGMELTRLLAEAGIDRGECFITNVTHIRPPGNDVEMFFHKPREAKLLGLTPWRARYPKQEIIDGIEILYEDIREIRPQIIIALGGVSLWALCAQRGIMSWRGSWLEHMGIPVMPTIHPAAILRNWADRFLALKDLQRVGRALKDGVPRRPPWVFYTRPSFDQVMERLALLQGVAEGSGTLLRITADIETRGGQIACLGIGWRGASHLEALCIPFMCVEGDKSYWRAEEELAIILALRRLFHAPNIRATFHNGAYDVQYFAHQWGFIPARIDDTMVMQHVAFSGLRKSLAVCSSLYCEWHRYWKEDGKTWEDNDEDQLWRYNCEDCVRTFEIREALDALLVHQQQIPQYEFQMAELWPEVLLAMLRGVAVDSDTRADLDCRLEVNMEACLAWLNTALGHPLNPRSTQVMQKLLYEDFQIPVIRNRKTGQPTCDDEALEKIARKYPLLRPLLTCIGDFRSLGVFLSTFVRAPLSPDGRMRCTYNVAGTETYRFSSSEDAFGFGTNLQNISAGDE